MTIKAAVSLPDDLFRKLERVRLGRGLSRSAAVKEALSGWLAAVEAGASAAAYVDAYRRIPEDLQEIEAWEMVETWTKTDET
jgi:metal-responsive CopG/Arc/MetJ family transcriptional regulator